MCVHCRWRVTPSLSFCLWSLCTHNSASRALAPTFSLARHENGSRASIRHHLDRPHIVLSRNPDLAVLAQTNPRAQNNLRVVGPHVLPAVCSFECVWIPQCVCMCICVFFVPCIVVVVVYVFSSPRHCICGCLCMFVRSRLRVCCTSVRACPARCVKPGDAKVTSKPRLTKGGPAP